MVYKAKIKIKNKGGLKKMMARCKKSWTGARWLKRGTQPEKLGEGTEDGRLSLLQISDYSIIVIKDNTM